ncbi:hypothetical protein APHAL10511_005989 [Amanita phalloides]|nr:hypothetical protein APHAL10511_005989 [Amanita phalloides]
MSTSWEVRLSRSKSIPYFYNTETGESTWKEPSDLTEDEIKKLPGYDKYLKPQPPAAHRVRASHILVKHKGSRRPSSWKEANITRSKEEAIDILRGYEEEINGSLDKLAELAEVHSDCSSHAQRGDLGEFGRGQMQKAFEDVAFGLKVGEMSDIVSTDSGVHLILRTG